MIEADLETYVDSRIYAQVRKCYTLYIVFELWTIEENLGSIYLNYIIKLRMTFMDLYKIGMYKMTWKKI